MHSHIRVLDHPFFMNFPDFFYQKCFTWFPSKWPSWMNWLSVLYTQVIIYDTNSSKSSFSINTIFFQRCMWIDFPFLATMRKPLFELDIRNVSWQLEVSGSQYRNTSANHITAFWARLNEKTFSKRPWVPNLWQILSTLHSGFTLHTQDSKYMWLSLVCWQLRDSIIFGLI